MGRKHFKVCAILFDGFRQMRIVLQHRVRALTGAASLKL